MAQWHRNVGLSEDIKQMVLHAHLTSDILVLQLFGVYRTVLILDLLPQDDELVVTCSDVDDFSTVILHLPYTIGSLASAEIIQYTEGGA